MNRLGLESVSGTSTMERRCYRADYRAGGACTMPIVIPLVSAQRSRDLTIVVSGPGYPMSSDG